MKKEMRPAFYLTLVFIALVLGMFGWAIYVLYIKK